MRNRNRSFDGNYLLRHFEGALEIALLTIIYFYMWKLFLRDDSLHFYYGNGKYILMLVYALIALVLFSFSECFKFGALRYSDIVISSFIAITLDNVITYFQVCLLSNRMVSFYPFLLLFVMDFLIIAFVCYIYTVSYYKLNPPHNMLLITGDENGKEVKKKFDRRDDKYLVQDILQLSDVYKKTDLENPCLDDVINIIYEQIGSHESVVLNDIPADERNAILKYCYEHSVRTYVVPKISDIIMMGSQDVNLFDTPIQVINGVGISYPERVVKRGMDLFLSLFFLIMTSPIMLIIALAIKIEDGGPVFFKQERVTRAGKLYKILKFRSMIENANKEGEIRGTTNDDKRVTKVGTIIRRYRLDELPQLINIIKGDMSLVGPRPECKEFHEKYCRDIPEFIFRNRVKAGLTGYAQIYGKYNTSSYDKLRLDLIYIERYSLMMDIKLILMTLRILFKKESTDGFEEENEQK